MAKKLFLNTERAIRTAHVPSVSREEPESEEVLFSDRNSPESEITEQLPFFILSETTKTFSKFNANGRSLLIKFKPPGEEQEPTAYLKECITSLTNYLFDDVHDRDLVGLRISNTENFQDKVVVISFRRRDQLKPDVIWSVLGKVVQSNARFGLRNRLEVHLDHVRMPAGNGREKTKGRSLDVISAIKKSNVVVKAKFLCLAHALIIAMARVNGDPKYKSYRNGRGLNEHIQDLLSASGVDLRNGGALMNLNSFKITFRITKLLSMMV